MWAARDSKFTVGAPSRATTSAYRLWGWLAVRSDPTAASPTTSFAPLACATMRSTSGTATRSLRAEACAAVGMRSLHSSLFCAWIARHM